MSRSLLVLLSLALLAAAASIRIASAAPVVGTETICDGIDNDGDQIIDNSPIGTVGGDCGATDVGACSYGTVICAGTDFLCDNEIAATSEMCDSVDSNCNGVPDESDTMTDTPSPAGCWTEAGTTCSVLINGGATAEWNFPTNADCTTLGTLTGACAVGTMTCDGSGYTCTGAVAPVAETCNGVDDDCNGSVDDSVPNMGAACGTDVGECTAGTNSCVSGAIVCSDVPPAAETCNGLDDDCDGVIDNGVATVGDACSTSLLGECTAGTFTCQGAGGIQCSATATSTTEICNGLDDDCDGTIDNVATVGDSCGSAVGTCTIGTKVCDVPNGVVKCNGVAAVDETCDGADNDCDGTVDNNLTDGPVGGSEGCWSTSGSTCSFSALTWNFPTGASCNAKGSLVAACAAGALTCDSGAYACIGAIAPVAETCNGVDDDCNGTIDDGVATSGDACGVIVNGCTAGVNTCTNGAFVCVGGIQPVAETCNGVDDDCDGQIDEGLTCSTAVSVTGYPSAAVSAGAVVTLSFSVTVAPAAGSLVATVTCSAGGTPLGARTATFAQGVSTAQSVTITAPSLPAQVEIACVVVLSGAAMSEYTGPDQQTFTVNAAVAGSTGSATGGSSGTSSGAGGSGASSTGDLGNNCVDLECAAVHIAQPAAIIAGALAMLAMIRQ